MKLRILVTAAAAACASLTAALAHADTSTIKLPGAHPEVHPPVYADGRFHFTDRITLTMRIGHPTASVGVSFLL